MICTEMKGSIGATVNLVTHLNQEISFLQIQSKATDNKPTTVLTFLYTSLWQELLLYNTRFFFYDFERMFNPNLEG